MDLNGVSETMLLTLYSKASHSKSKNPKFYDKKAIEIISKIDYDFSIAKKDYFMKNGVIARTILLDKMVKEYLNKHPNTTIINIASGLDTRFYRLNNDKIKWYNIDLPEAVEFSKQYIKDSENVKSLSYSAMDTEWASEITMNDKENVLFIIEGLTMYLNQEDVEKIFEIIDENFYKCTVFVEIMTPKSVENIKEPSVDKTESKFVWGVDNGYELLNLNPSFKWLKDENLFKGMNELNPLTRIFTWIPMIKNRMNYIAVLEK